MSENDQVTPSSSGLNVHALVTELSIQVWHRQISGYKESTSTTFATATGTVITPVAGGTKADVDIAVDAAKKVGTIIEAWLHYMLILLLQAYKTSWGLKCPGAERGKLLNKLADLVEKNIDEFAALETLNTGACSP